MTRDGQNVGVQIIDSVAMTDMQKAVTDYRSRILPVVYVLAQKVYAEFFRLVLFASGVSAGDKQFDVETQLSSLVARSAVTTFSPFADQGSFLDWWNGTYSFTVLRQARNRVVHQNYTFAPPRLTVHDDRGVLLLDWSESDILDFAREVVRIGRSV